jgi:hypothetical protein
MEWEQEQKIIKYLNKINEEIRLVDDNIGDIPNVSTCVRNARFEILHIIHLLKLSNVKEEEQEKKDGKKEIIQHKVEGQKVRP